MLSRGWTLQGEALAQDGRTMLRSFTDGTDMVTLQWYQVSKDRPTTVTFLDLDNDKIAAKHYLDVMAWTDSAGYLYSKTEREALPNGDNLLTTYYTKTTGRGLEKKFSYVKIGRVTQDDLIVGYKYDIASF